ncbi:MAG: glycosyltransferase family 39 protein [Bacteroidales bacterium]|jgi:hypothetical protein
MTYLKRVWNEQPLALVMLTAIFLRLLAVVFSKGFGMLDDHFLVIEAAQSWVNGYDYNNWLPASNPTGHPSGHGMFYVGLNFFLLKFLHFTGMTDPQGLMYVERFLHALLSLIVVFYGFKITEKISNLNNARIVGIIFASFFMFPFLSVRNLVEVVCIPFLILSVWQLIKDDELKNKHYLLSGIFAAIAVGLRVQTMFFITGLGLYLLIKKQWRGFGIWAVIMFIVYFLLQGAPDIFLWGYPFAEVSEYIKVCVTTADAYIVQPWFTYFLFILGILIPPISIFMLMGYIKGFKKLLIITLPVFIFLLGHIIISNKQERFMLPVIPFFIISGVVGMNDFIFIKPYWQKHKIFIKVSWIIFWSISCMALPFVTTHYSKRSRCEAMYYLNQYKSNITSIVLDDMNYHEPEWMPLFYLGKWNVRESMISEGNPFGNFKNWINSIDKKNYPQFILFFGEENLQVRVDTVKQVMPDIVLEKTIYPDFIDWLLHTINKHNNNQTVFIYRNNRSFYFKK